MSQPYGEHFKSWVSLIFLLSHIHVQQFHASTVHRHMAATWAVEKY
jgi:hypothetical protein